VFHDEERNPPAHAMRALILRFGVCTSERYRGNISTRGRLAEVRGKFNDSDGSGVAEFLPAARGKTRPDTCCAIVIARTCAQGYFRAAGSARKSHFLMYIPDIRTYIRNARRCRSISTPITRIAAGSSRETETEREREREREREEGEKEWEDARR